MTTDGYVHGQTNAKEIARLEKQADFTSSLTFSRLPIRAGHQVLDLATGVGAMGVRLQRSFPRAHVVGLDLSASQLAAAKSNHPTLGLVRGDATRLPFPDGHFDVVHASWLLEHVPSPVAVLREVFRVLKPGGTCHFIEVDNATFDCSPASAEVRAVMTSLNEAQAKGGGDPFVGQKLERHFAEAGFTSIRVERTPLLGSPEAPEFFGRFVVEFAEIFEGLEESLGPTLGHAVLARASAHLRALESRADGRLRYTPVIAEATR